MADGLVIRIDTLGEEQIARKLLRFSHSAANAAPALEAVHDYLTQVSEEQFRTQGRQSGHPWDELKQATIDRKRRSRDPQTVANAEKILHASEKLRNSLVNQGDKNMVHVITNDTMIYGTKLPYGRAHQRPPLDGHFPRRRPVDLTEVQKLTIIKTIQLWIVRGVVRVPGGRRFF